MFKKGLINKKIHTEMQSIFAGGSKGKLCLLGGPGGSEANFFQEIYYVICEFNKFEFSKEGPEPHPHHYIDPNMNSDLFLRKSKKRNLLVT